MYYEECVIDGVVCCRTTPDGEWRQLTPRQLTDKIVMLENGIREVDAELATMSDRMLNLEAAVEQFLERA
jgi:hypothetical protein